MIRNIVTAQKILQSVKDATKILLITHQNPDGDGLGAMSALALYLTKLGKSITLFCVSPVLSNDKFLPLIHQVTCDQEQILNNQFDLIIILDSGSLVHAGVDQLIKRVDYPYQSINIDHHLSNDNFADLNLVQSLASSTSEIIYDLFRLWKVTISKEMATALLNGIVFDTNLFSNDATTWPALVIAAHLLNLGARHHEINHNILRNKSLNLLKLWGRAFERLSFNPQYGLAFTVLTLADFNEAQVESASVEGLANFFNQLSGAKAVLVIIEKEPGLIKGSLRTTSEEINVNKLASLWGGGGHRKAAGFSLTGRLVYNNDKWQVL